MRILKDLNTQALEVEPITPKAKTKENVLVNFGCPSCPSHFGTLLELGSHLLEFHTAKPRAEIERSFQALKNHEKWILSTGTIVEGNLYIFGKSQIGEHPSQLLIFDCSDSNLYVENSVFTEEEIVEIQTYKNLKPTSLPEDFKQYLNKFNCKSTTDIRKALSEPQSWEGCYDRTRHFDLDWIKHSIHTLIREYENGSFKKNHAENWYNIHVWCLVDNVFGNLDGIEIIRGEESPIASDFRKNYKRTIEDVNNHTRQSMGRRFDYLIRQTNPNSSNSLEFGVSEVDKQYKVNGNKRITERGLKLPKVLKDMLDILVQENKGDCTVGVVHSG